LIANFVELSYMYLYSPVLGYSRAHMEEEAIRKEIKIVPTKFGISSAEIIRKRGFIKDYFLLLFLIYISFGGLYTGIYHIDNTQFNGVCKGTYWLDMFYFSAVTMATVGFGDISPADWIPKLLVTLQIIFSFLGIFGIISIISIKGNET